MALQLNLLSKQQLEAEIEAAKLALKALPEEERESSQEFQTLSVLERKKELGLYNRFGQQSNEAYLRISHCQEVADGINAEGGLYTCQDARHSDCQMLCNFSISLSHPESINTNLRTTVYEYIKTLPEFEGVVDC